MQSLVEPRGSRAGLLLSCSCIKLHKTLQWTFAASDHFRFHNSCYSSTVVSRLDQLTSTRSCLTTSLFGPIIVENEIPGVISCPWIIGRMQVSLCTVACPCADMPLVQCSFRAECEPGGCKHLRNQCKTWHEQFAGLVVATATSMCLALSASKLETPKHTKVN